jgi:subtilisin family serine protease
MHRRFAAALMSLALVGPALAEEPRYRVVVALRDSGERDAVRRMADIEGSQRRAGGRLDGRSGRVSHLYTAIPAFTAEVTREGWAALVADPDVVGVQLDEQAQVAMASVASMVHSTDVQSLGFTGKGVTVAVIDTGVDSSHPDLVGAVTEEICMCQTVDGRGCCPNGTVRQVGPGSARDDNGHGTHIAGIIAGRGHVAARGMAPDASLVAIKVANAQGVTSTSAMIAAIDWVLTSRPDARIVNMSLETSSNYPAGCEASSSIAASFASGVQRLRSQGGLLLAAAGNAGIADRLATPACVTGALSVGAVYSKAMGSQAALGCSDATTAADQVACFSNGGTGLALLAPGGAVVSLLNGGGLGVGSGTSQATAVASGAVALLLEASPKATVEQIVGALRSSGTPVRDTRTGRTTPRLDARAALAAIAGR